MSSMVSGVLLQAQSSPVDGSFFLMMGSVLLIMYLLVLRPESQKRKQLEAAIQSAEKGDEVVTTGGIQGLITGVTDDIVTVAVGEPLKSGERLRVKIQRSAITSVSKAGGKAEMKGGDS
jgi:preprotein translocase subunit YajC